MYTASAGTASHLWPSVSVSSLLAFLSICKYESFTASMILGVLTMASGLLTVILEVLTMMLGELTMGLGSSQSRLGNEALCSANCRRKLTLTNFTFPLLAHRLEIAVPWLHRVA